MATSDREAYLALFAATGVGPRTAGALVRAFGSPARAACASERDLARCRGVGTARAREVARALRDADPARIEARARAAGLVVLTPADLGYPPALLTAPDPPVALHVRGRLPDPPPTRPWLAIVGTRGASPYGERIARGLAEALSRDGAVVVSGFARGIDAAAHAGALAGGGETVAVLGCGADVVYPPEHAALAEEVARAGALVSEFPPGTAPHPGHFPRRNRVVAALVRALVVVEAPTRSGALLTARLAVEAGREVLAVPGPVDRGTHGGCHRLLREGAAMCEGPDDVRRALGLAPDESDAADARDAADRPRAARRAAASTAPPPAVSGPALAVFLALDLDEARDANEIARRTALSPDAVGYGLTLLEVEGRVRMVPGIGYLRA